MTPAPNWLIKYATYLALNSGGVKYWSCSFQKVEAAPLSGGEAPQTELQTDAFQESLFYGAAERVRRGLSTEKALADTAHLVSAGLGRLRQHRGRKGLFVPPLRNSSILSRLRG